MSIKTKIAWAVFLLVAALMTLLSLAGYHYLARTLKEEISRQSSALLDIAARHTDADITQSEEMLALMAREIGPGRLADAKGLQRRLDDEEPARTFFDGGFQVLDADGRVVAESPATPESRGARLPGRDYVAMVLATGKPYVSALHQNSGRPTVSIGVPILRRDGSVAGVLAGHNDLLTNSSLSDFGQLVLGKRGTFFLMERNRNIIMHPDHRRIMEHLAPGDSPGLDRVLQENLTVPQEDTDARGVRVITSARALKNANWLVVSQFPISEAYAPLDRARTFFAAALAVTLGLTHLALWRLIGRITAPLVLLTRHVRALPYKVGEERLVTLAGGDEVEALGFAVNEMVGEMDRKQEVQVQLEREINEQRQFAENLLESTSTPLFAIDTGHRIIIWNRAMTELTGVPAAQMLGTDHQWQPFYPARRPTLSDLVLDGRTTEVGSFYQEFERDVVMQGILRAEGWYPNLNGHDRRLFFDAAPVLKDGEVVAVVETLYDITARMRAEDRLRLLSRAVEQTASTIVITDHAGTILYVNNAFCRITGYGHAEVIGQNPRILKSGVQQPGLYQELWGAITSGREWHGELHNRRKDGTLFWENAIISPITDTSGAISNVLAVKEDITSRKDTERQLLKKQAELVLRHEQLTELFRQVEQGKREWEQTMDCIDAMVAMVDSQGRIRRCNRAFMKLAGCSYQELIATEWSALLRGAGLEIGAAGEGSGELFHAPSARWLTLKTYPYDEGRGEVIMLHDLTEIREVSEQLATAYQELKATHSQLLQQEKMASIGQLAAGVAHEINNPMGFISSNLGTMGKYLERLTGFLELQSAGVESCAPPELKEEIAQARRSCKVDYILKDAVSLLAESKDGAERVRTIVQNLKSFSRVDEAQASYVDLNDCLETTITIAWNELKYKTTLQRDYGELPQVRCLAQQLNQVFLNILVNAAHAIEKQGEVAIVTRSLGDRVTVAISDTGCGIPQEIQNRIFEPFFTTKEVGKGTGLGLSISYDIIKKHGGSIEVASTQGCGTTFTITLPIEGVQG